VRRGAASCRAVLGSCPVAEAVRAPAQVPSPRSRPGWTSAPRRCDPGEVGPPSGWSPARGCPDAGQAGRCPVPAPGPAVGRPSSRSSGRPTSRRPVSRRPVSRRPDGQASAVRGNAAARSASRWTWSGWGVGPPGWAQWVEVPPVSAGGWSPACIGPDGKRWCGGWPCPAATRSTVAQGRRWPTSRLRRRLAAGPTRALVQGAGRVAGEHGMQRYSPAPQGVLGRSSAWCPTMAWTRRW
jgi:hypothetical protein